MADAVIVGAGLVGLSCAAALAARGADVIVVGDHRPGEASPAAAGMLAPSVEGAAEAGGPGGAVLRFALAARDRYPSFLSELAELTGTLVPLNRRGILELALTERDAESMSRGLPGEASWLDGAALLDLDSSFAHAAGAIYHPFDGCVDNEALLRVLELALGRMPSVRFVRELVVSIASPAGSPPEVITASGSRLGGRRVVLAAGAWVNRIAGVPRQLPVEPMRGQMIAFDAAPPPLVTYGPGGYVVPRSPSRTLVGSTMERVGFDIGTTDEGVAALRAAAVAIAPSLVAAPVAARWSGLRPVTPDLLPIIGPDPAHPQLLYACGHSRNGILLAPLTGDCVAALVTGDAPPTPLDSYRPGRFLDR